MFYLLFEILYEEVMLCCIKLYIIKIDLGEEIENLKWYLLFRILIEIDNIWKRLRKEMW